MATAVNPAKTPVAADGHSERWSPLLREAGVATGAGILVLLASLANFLGHNEYPLWTPEVGVATLALVAVAASVGLTYLVVGQLGRVLLQHCLVFMALDLNFDFIVAVVGTVAIGLVLRQRMLLFIAIAAGVVLVTQAAGVGLGATTGSAPSVPGAQRSDAPLLVHVVLDEHIGIEGLIDTPRGVAMREKLIAFYSGNGFRLFGGAYSHYLHTVNSMPEVLNFGALPPVASFDVNPNAYFDRLGELGYGIHVWQTDFLRYCDNAFVVSCRTRRAFDAHDLVEAPLPATVKAKLLIDSMATLSDGIGNLSIIYDGAALAGRYVGLRLPLYRLRDRPMPAAVGALETIDAVVAELRGASRGEAYFVHDLVPHDPFILTPECGIKQAHDWQNRSGPRAAKERREEAYFDQIDCLLVRLQVLLDAIAASPAGEDAIVLIHGDHGSRITDVDPTVETEGRFTDADLIAGYSALFAVRASGIAPGYESRRLSLSELVTALAGSGFAEIDVPHEPDRVHLIVLENRETEPVKQFPLPAWWVDHR